jgi:hypothetical protein
VILIDHVLKAFGIDLFGEGRAKLYTEYCSDGDLLEQMIHLHRDLKVTLLGKDILRTLVSSFDALAYLH